MHDNNNEYYKFVQKIWPMIRLPISNCPIKRPLTFLPTFVLLWFLPGAECVPAEDYADRVDNWVATDALGRTLPDHAQVGDRRPGKFVGIFYFVWVGNHTEKVYDISKILEESDESKRVWGPERAHHFGCEPEQGYFHASDPWVIRRDIQMLANADVDFLFLDVTNAVIYERTVDALLAMILQMRAEGIPAPQVTFVTNAASGKTMNRIYERFYRNPDNRGAWFEWKGKPLIFGIADDPVLRKEVAEFYTIKRSWAGPLRRKNRITGNGWTHGHRILAGVTHRMFPIRFRSPRPHTRATPSVKVFNIELRTARPLARIT